MGPEATASVKAGATLGQCGAEEGKVRKLLYMSERHPMKSWQQVASLCSPTRSPCRAEPGDPVARLLPEAFAGPRQLSDGTSGLSPGWLVGDTGLQEGCLALSGGTWGLELPKPTGSSSRAEGGQP